MSSLTSQEIAVIDDILDDKIPEITFCDYIDAIDHMAKSKRLDADMVEKLRVKILAEVDHRYGARAISR